MWTQLLVYAVNDIEDLYMSEVTVRNVNSCTVGIVTQCAVSNVNNKKGQQQKVWRLQGCQLPPQDILCKSLRLAHMESFLRNCY